MQKGGINVPENNDNFTSSVSDHSTVNPLLGAQSTDQRPLVTSQYVPLITTTSFNNSSTVEGVKLGDTWGLGWQLRVIYILQTFLLLFLV